MKEDVNDYARDLAEIRSIMERSSKFLSLSGWEGIMAGVYALIGAFVVHQVFGFRPDQVHYSFGDMGSGTAGIAELIGTAVLVLVMALATAIFFSSRKAQKLGEKAWTPATRRLLYSMAVPLVSGGIFILLLVWHGLLGLVAPLMLLFYGLALYNAGKYTVDEVKYMGMVQIALGLTGAVFIEYGLLLWAAGFGVVHIVYGIFMHFRYER
jgi:hypothetical protein